MMHTPPTLSPLSSWRLSGEAVHLRRSVMRDLLALATSSDVLSLAGGLPATDALPTDALRTCMADVLTRDGGRALQYNPPYMPLRAWIADHMRTRGVSCSAEDIFLTNGNQHGLTILSRLLVDPGCPVVIEDATFTGIQQITTGRGAAVTPIPADPQRGADLEALEAAFTTSPRMAVLIPDFHNPLGVTLAASHRQQIAALAARHGVPVIEDDPYSALRFTGDPLPPLKAFDEADTVFYLGSFSKMLAPSLRLGWMVAPRALMPRITAIRESIDLESSALIQRAVFHFLENGLLPDHLKRLNALNRARCDALLNALRRHLPFARWSQPEGGLFVWVTFPEQVDTWALFERAAAAGVIYIPGGAFSVNGGHSASMRLNFSGLPAEAIEEAVSRLGSVVRAAHPELA